MNNSHHQPDNDRLFDLLVDGELSDAERRELLASLDEREEGWRRCALAFLEAQNWGRQFRQIVAESDAPTAVVATTAKAERPHVGRWFALAAALLLAFLIGRWGGGQGSAPHIAQTEPETESSPLAAAPPVDDGDVVTMLVRDVHGNNQRLHVPLVDTANWQSKRGSLPDGLRERLLSQGVDLQSRRRFAPIFFEQRQGGVVPMFVSVDDVRVVPVKYTVY
jgi:hypothetical protein